jgi:protein SCO1/2
MTRLDIICQRMRLWRAKRSFMTIGLAFAIAACGGVLLTASPDRRDDKTRAARSAAVIARLFPRSEDHDFAAPQPGTYKLPVIKPAGDGEIIGIDGEATTLAQQMKGRITILSFIYTMCSDEKGCPLATARLFDAHDVSKQLPEIARNARFITLSFDPARDTPAAIKSYASAVIADPEYEKKAPWSFFTTRSAEQLKPILSAFGQVIHPSNDGETISHLLRLYLIDRKGDIRNIYGLGFLDPRLMLADIETLLMEEKASDGDAS